MQAHHFIDETNLAPDSTNTNSALRAVIAYNDLAAVRPVTGEAEPSTGSAATALRQTVVPRRARILYVDDDPQLRMLGKRVLVQLGYDVDTAADGAEAWTALQEVNNANGMRQGSAVRISVLSRMANSIQPFLHGGINE